MKASSDPGSVAGCSVNPSPAPPPVHAWTRSANCSGVPVNSSPPGSPVSSAASSPNAFPLSRERRTTWSVRLVRAAGGIAAIASALSGWPGSISRQSRPELCARFRHRNSGSTASSSAARSERASASVDPSTNDTPGSTSTRPGSRPWRAAASRTASRNRRPAAMSGCAVNTRSAVFPASSIPGPDDPACANAGRPWGERGSVNAPLTLKNFPWKSTGRIRSVFAHTAAAPGSRPRSATTAPASQLSHSREATSTNSSARAYLRAASGCSASPKLPAAPAYRVVTMFHPARPPDRWSIVDSRRARSYGWL